VAARLADKVGRPGIAQLVRSLGVKSKINTDPAMALGTAEATPLEMAQAYAPFANGGYRVNHHAIIRVRTASKGQILFNIGALPKMVSGFRLSATHHLPI